MITPLYTKAIKKELGKQYSPVIIAHLSKKKIFNAKGLPFKPKSIQEIVNGGLENLVVQKEIFKLLDKVKKQKQIDLQNQKEIIKK